MNELTDLSDCLLLLNVPYNARLLSQGKRLKIDHSIVARHIIQASQPNLVVGDCAEGGTVHYLEQFVQKFPPSLSWALRRPTWSTSPAWRGLPGLRSDPGTRHWREHAGNHRLIEHPVVTNLHFISNRLTWSYTLRQYWLPREPFVPLPATDAHTNKHHKPSGPAGVWLLSK